MALWTGTLHRLSLRLRERRQSMSTPFSSNRLREDVDNFSVVLGGPLFQLLHRIHTSDDALHLAKRRIILITLLTWLPLLVFTIIDGSAWSDALVVPFL